MYSPSCCNGFGKNDTAIRGRAIVRSNIRSKWLGRSFSLALCLCPAPFIFRRQNCRYMENNARTQNAYTNCNVCIVNIKLVLCPFRFPHNNKWKRSERCTDTHTERESGRSSRLQSPWLTHTLAVAQTLHVHCLTTKTAVPSKHHCDIVRGGFQATAKKRRRRKYRKHRTYREHIDTLTNRNECST